MSEAHDFWLSCGHQLLDHDESGQLLVTDEFLKAYLARREIAPPPEACAAERSLHQKLLANPRLPVGKSEIAGIADPDARENWEVLLAFRNHLIEHRTIEAAYVDIVRARRRVPPLFLNQLVHLILRNVLNGSEDAWLLRAAEFFFRPQKLTLHDGALLAADEETISGLGKQPVSPLVSMLGLPAASEIDVLNDSNAATYWERSDKFDMALDLTAGRQGLAALGQVVSRWVHHLLAVDVRVEPLVEVQNVALTWYVGLDAEATRIGDALWNGGELDDGVRNRIVGLFKLTFPNALDVVEKVRGEPVYLIAAMDEEKVLRVKPQNLISGLPLRDVGGLN